MSQNETQGQSIDFLSSLEHWREWYLKRPAAIAIWKNPRAFFQFIRSKREYFSDEAIVTLRNGVYVAPVFESELALWLRSPKPRSIEHLKNYRSRQAQGV